jgi:ABC-type nitrate/sulfonate/bicarbonate transport system substrate-binding protein
VVQITANVSIAALATQYRLQSDPAISGDGNLRGLPIKVAGFSPTTQSCVVANPKLARFTDLKGRKIAISSFGSATDILARLTVEHFKLNPQKDVQFIAAGSSSGRLAQLESGLVDAAVVSPPSDQVAEARGFKTLVRTRDVLLFPVNGVGLHGKSCATAAQK